MRYLHTSLKCTAAPSMISKRTLRELAVFCSMLHRLLFPTNLLLSRHRGYGRAVGTSSRCPL
jgi:hypothetical protein